METTVEALKDAMRKGVVKFQYVKKDGTIRTATGTLNLDIINENYSFKDSGGPDKYGYTPYWDIEKDGWRCFNNDSIVGIL